jgi:tetratricopeptide (TPR) repeat protein
MRPFLICIAVSAALILPAPAQQPAATPPSINIYLKDGRTITTNQALGRSGNAVMVTVPMGATLGQMGYDVTAILRVDFPEPPQIKEATDQFTAGNLDQGLADLEPVLNYYAPFRDVPGSWWLKAALLKVNALINAGRKNEAGPLVSDLSNCIGDPEAVNAGKVFRAEDVAQSGGHEEALQTFNAVISGSKNKDTLAEAWLYKGESLFALRRFEPAILAYLHVPVFYPEDKLLVPDAMLGGARAMIGLQDGKGAKDELDELVKNFPSSPQATAAKAELEKLEKDQNQKQ